MSQGVKEDWIIKLGIDEEVLKVEVMGGEPHQAMV